MARSRSDIINQIKGLLRMDKGGESTEIETALFLAKKLADKYQIDLDAVNPEEYSETVSHQTYEGKSRIQYEEKYSLLILIQFFNVESLTISGFKKQVVIIGTKSNIEIADYTYSFLIKHFRNEWKKNKGRLKKRQAFMYGMYSGICYKLSKANNMLSQSEGLVLREKKEELRDYIQEQFGETTKTSVVLKDNSKSAYNKGFVSGMRTNIHKGIDSKTNKKQLNQ